MTERLREERTFYEVKVKRHSGMPRAGDFEIWKKDGQRHRVNGPAIIEYDIHTGVAVYESWWQKDVLHRTDGPAIIRRDKTTGRIFWTQWYIDGQKVKPPRQALPRRLAAPVHGANSAAESKVPEPRRSAEWEYDERHGRLVDCDKF